MRMDDQDKPPLIPYVYEEIAKSLYKVDKIYRDFLLELRVSHPGEPGATYSPAPPRLPEHLRTAVCFYACELFKTEATEYPFDPQIKHWLSKLQQRVIENVISTIKLLDNSLFSRFLGTEGKYGLSWHGLCLDDMRQSMNESLDELRAKTLESYSTAIASKSMLTGKQAASFARAGIDITSGSPLLMMLHTAVQKEHLQPPNVRSVLAPVLTAARKRIGRSIHSEKAARRMEAYIQEKGITRTQFSMAVNADPKTLYRFRKSAKVEKSVAKRIADEMGITLEDFLA